MNSKTPNEKTAKREKDVKEQQCETCRFNFTPKKIWQKFCSKKCRNSFFWSHHEIVCNGNNNWDYQI